MKTKKYLALMTAGFLAITPMAATGLTAVADYTISVTPNKAGTHNYAAYEILKGDVSGEKLSNIAWGDNMPSDRSALLTALKSDSVFGADSSNLFYSLTTSSTPEEFANVIKNITSESNQANELAKVLGSYVSGAAKATDNTADYSLGGLTGGYYLVRDEASTSTSTPRTLNLLKVAGNVEITTKEDLPTLEKKILEDRNNDGTDEEYDANTARIGDVVTYEIKTKVPDMTGYNKYFFIVDDTLSKGLTYNNDLSITYGSGTALTLDSDGAGTNNSGDYYVTATDYNDTNGTSIKVIFEDFLANMKAKNVAAGTDITITYTATLNSNAVITNAGNPNSAKLTYSNDPNVTSVGNGSEHPDEPLPPDDTPGSEIPGDAVGETPDSTVKTYTTAIRIKKVDQNGAALTGAKFTLTSSNMKYVKVVSLTEFVVDNENGTYYKLADGTYTKTAPAVDGSTDALYDSTSTKYKKQTADSQSTATEYASGTDYEIEAQVDANGYITFYGLTAGTYTLEETVVPDGYNKASNEEITILNSPDPSSSSPNWSVSNGTSNLGTDDDGAYYITIQNRQGSTLPSTGGIGTKLFYIIGGFLVAGSVIFFVTKKRMNTKEN